VGDEDAINVGDVVGECLLSKVGANVNENSCVILCCVVPTAAKVFVSWVERGTHLAIAAYHGDTV